MTPSLPLAFIGARTSRIRLGSGVVQVGARTPALVAMTLATQPARRLPCASPLGSDQSLRELRAELASPDPDLRFLKGPFAETTEVLASYVLPPDQRVSAIAGRRAELRHGP